jgi:hypothetical protein
MKVDFAFEGRVVRVTHKAGEVGYVVRPSCHSLSERQLELLRATERRQNFSDEVRPFIMYDYAIGPELPLDVKRHYDEFRCAMANMRAYTSQVRKQQYRAEAAAARLKMACGMYEVAGLDIDWEAVNALCAVPLE